LSAGKTIAATLCVWFGFAVNGVVSPLAGLAAIGSAPLVGLSGQLISTGHALAGSGLIVTRAGRQIPAS
jgi:hypothetical protein